MMTICSRCSNNLAEGLEFCTACGIKLSNNENKKMFCLHCKTVYADGSIFCKNCGSKLVNQEKKITEKDVCPYCLHQNHPEMLFCISCGKKLKDGLATILGQEESSPPSYNPSSSDAPVLQQNLTSSNAFPKKQRRHKKAMITLIAVVACAVILVVTLTPRFRNTIGGFLGLRDRDSLEFVTFPGDRNERLAGIPAEVEVSKSKPVKASSGDGFSIFAPANALDKNRDFSIRKLDADEVNNYRDENLYPDLLPIASYEYDAGLGPQDFFPGNVELSFDLTQYDIPEEAYEDIVIVRYGKEENDVEILSGYLEGATYTCFTNKNSIIEIAVLVGILAPALFGGIHASENVSKFETTIGKDEKWHSIRYSSRGFRGITGPVIYTLYWPSMLKVPNPNAVKAAINEEIALYKKLGFLGQDYDPKWILEGIDTGYGDERRKTNVVRDLQHILFPEARNKLLRNAEYQALKRKYSRDWQLKNFVPNQISYFLKQLDQADKYLFMHRQFAQPSSVEIFFSLKSYGMDAAETYNPATQKPYMIMPILPESMIQDLNDPHHKRQYDELLIAVTHELFHVIQADRYIYTWDRDENTWFWEATAILLEDEALEYYKNKGLIGEGHILKKYEYYEAYGRTPGNTYFWGTLGQPGLTSHVTDSSKIDAYRQALTAQGYMTGYMLIFLRDRYYKGDDLEKEKFLHNLLDSWKGSKKRPFDLIIAQTSNSTEKMQQDLFLFYGKIEDKIVKRISEAKTAGKGFSILDEWIVYDKIELNENLPIATIIPTICPYSTIVREIGIRVDPEKYESDEIKFILLKEKKDRLQTSNYFNLRIGSFEGNVYESSLMKFVSIIEEFDIDVSKSVRGLYNAYIQELHLYYLYTSETMDDSGNVMMRKNFQHPYTVFLMLKPNEPLVEQKGSNTSENKNDYSVKIPKSPLHKQGIVKKWQVTVIDPYGNQIVFETEKDVLEFSIDSDKKTIEFKDPGIQKTVNQAISDSGGSAALEAIQDKIKQGAEDLADSAIEGLDELIDDIDVAELAEVAKVLMGEGAGTMDTGYTLSFCEITDTDKPIYGPQSDEVIIGAETVDAAEVDLRGHWSGKMSMTNQILNATITDGRDNHQYLMTFHYPDIDIPVYLDVGDEGIIRITPLPHDAEGFDLDQITGSHSIGSATMTLQSVNKIYLTSPPVFLERK